MRNKTLFTDKVDILRNVFYKVKKRHPCQLNAMVVLPSHLHVLLTLPPDDHDYSTIHRFISKGILKPDWGSNSEYIAEIECGERS